MPEVFCFINLCELCVTSVYSVVYKLRHNPVSVLPQSAQRFTRRTQRISRKPPLTLCYLRLLCGL